MRALQLCLRVRVVGSHIFQPTVQNAAELVEGVGADIPVFAQSVQLASADFVFFDKFILRDAFFSSSSPKAVQTKSYEIPSNLTIM